MTRLLMHARPLLLSDMSASFLYFARPRTDADASVCVTADAAGWPTLTRPSKVAFLLQL